MARFKIRFSKYNPVEVRRFPNIFYQNLWVDSNTNFQIEFSKMLNAVVTDNAANMIAVSERCLKPEYQVGCTAHTLMLSITNGLTPKKK